LIVSQPFLFGRRAAWSLGKAKQRSTWTTARMDYISALLDEVTPFRSYRINPAPQSRLDHLSDIPLEHISLSPDKIALRLCNCSVRQLFELPCYCELTARQQAAHLR
jgi:hypothetical protein